MYKYIILNGGFKVNCKEKGCNGKINKRNSLSLIIGSSGWGEEYAEARFCETCGRLYWKNGKPINNKSDSKAFLINKEIVFVKDTDHLKQKI